MLWKDTAWICRILLAVCHAPFSHQALGISIDGIIVSPSRVGNHRRFPGAAMGELRATLRMVAVSVRVSDHPDAARHGFIEIGRAHV